MVVRLLCAHVLLFSVAAAAMLCNPGTSAAANEQKCVLLLYDSRADMQANVFVDQTIRSVIDRELKVDVDVQSEYFEVSPLAKSEYPLLVSWLRRKYAGIRFDVVVAVGANALRFVREERELFVGARIVYWGRRTGLDSLESGPPITGVVAPGMETHANGALQFIRTLQPDLEQLIVVSGTSEVDREWEDAARHALRPFEGRITITYLAGLSLENLQEHLVSLPKNTAILFLTMNRDGAGRRLSKSEALNKVVQEAAAPVYSTSAIHLNTGIVGGALVSQESMAIEAAGLVIRLLRAENIQNMPVRESSLVPMVNWRGLTRWDIPEDRLSPGTVVMYKDQSIWTQYKWYIIGFGCLCILEGMLIIALLTQRANRRRAEKAMRESQRLLQSAIDALDAHIALLDEEGTIIAVNQPWRSFARVHGHDAAGDGVGRNYLEFCENQTAEQSRVVSNGIRSLLSGQVEDFNCIYPSVHGNETSWFQVRMNRFQTGGVRRFVVTHENVTEIKQAHDAQQHLSSLLLRAQDDARRRIARDLHDVTVQDLAAIRADLTRIQMSQTMDQGVQEILNQSLSLCDGVVRELRTLSYLLHPPLLDEAGLIPALRWFVRGFIQRSDVQVELMVMEDVGRLPTDAEIVLFRVVQECLTNIHRHSGSRSAVIWIMKGEGTIRVQITDDGHGFAVPADPAEQEATPWTGVGIMGMRQRLKELGGDLEIESSSQGTTVNAKIAISEARSAAHPNS